MRLFLSVAAALAFALPSFGGRNVAAASTPPPPPPVLTSSPSPSALATLSPATSSVVPVPLATPGSLLERPKAASKTGPTPSPPPNPRVGIEGVWEVQIQRGSQVTYTHWNLKQTGSVLTGIYRDTHGKQFPLAGSLDGKTLRIVVSMPDGTTKLFQAQIDGTTDMLGMLTDPKESDVPFTAAYRPKTNFIDNINAGAGALGGIGSGAGGGGGYPPR